MTSEFNAVGRRSVESVFVVTVFISERCENEIFMNTQRMRKCRTVSVRRNNDNVMTFFNEYRGEGFQALARDTVVVRYQNSHTG